MKIIGFDDITGDNRLWAVHYEGDEDNILNKGHELPSTCMAQAIETALNISL